MIVFGNFNCKDKYNYLNKWDLKIVIIIYKVKISLKKFRINDIHY